MSIAGPTRSRDPQTFCSTYRERTGLSEEQLNPAVIRHFTILGMTCPARSSAARPFPGGAALHRGDVSNAVAHMQHQGSSPSSRGLMQSSLTTTEILEASESSCGKRSCPRSDGPACCRRDARQHPLELATCATRDRGCATSASRSTRLPWWTTQWCSQPLRPIAALTARVFTPTRWRLIARRGVVVCGGVRWRTATRVC